MKKIVCALISIIMIFSSFVSFADPNVQTNVEVNTQNNGQNNVEVNVEVNVESNNKTISFTDVNPDTEVGKAIMKLADAGIISGNGDGTFAPKRCVTRAELCKMINNIKKYTEEDATAFSDVTVDKWYYSHVKIAKKAGYINGFEDGTFRGDQYVTREQACAILVRVLGLYDLGLPVTISDAVSPWAENYVKTVISNTLINLEDGNLFRATEDMTREELSLPLANFVVESHDDIIITDEKKDTEKEDKKEENKGSVPSGNSSPNKNDKEDEEDDEGITGVFGGDEGETGDSGNNGNEENTEEVFDETKQKEVVEKLTTLTEELDYIVTLPWVEFTESENEILAAIKEVVGKTLTDANEGKWIYVEDYVLKTYNSEVMAARTMYKSLEEKGEDEALKEKLGELPIYLVEYLADTMFGIDIKEHM